MEPLLKDTSEIRSLGYSGHLTESQLYINSYYSEIRTPHYIGQLFYSQGGGGGGGGGGSILERFHCIHKKKKRIIVLSYCVGHSFYGTCNMFQ